MIKREIETQIAQRLGKGKVILLTGPRQVGKTTLLNTILAERAKDENQSSQYWNCDETDVRTMLTNINVARLKSMIGSSRLIVIDEGQRIKDIGIVLKLMHDNFKDVQIAVTGSSSLDLASSVNEPLTGRKVEFNLYPFSVREMVDATSYLEEKKKLDNRLIFGLYPEVVNNPGREKEIIHEISSSYLYKDIFEFRDLRKPMVIERLLQALALQVGSEVSFSELSSLLGIDSVTVQRYIDVLEKAFVVFHLSSYSRNVRNELKKSIKIYFYDNGVRNSIINNFSPLELRTDKGALFENFIISERMKNAAYSRTFGKLFFWRTTQKQEIDLVEENDGRMASFEIKYNPSKANTRCPLTYAKAYPESSYEVITSDSYIDNLSKKQIPDPFGV